MKQYINKPANKQTNKHTTPQSRVLPHKLTVPQLDKKFPPPLPPILCNMKAYYGINKSLQLVHSPSQMHPVHNLPSCIFRIHFDSILPSVPWSMKWSLSNQKLVCISLPYMPHDLSM